MDKKLTAKYLVKTIDKFKSRVTAYDNYAIIVNNRHYTVHDFLQYYNRISYKTKAISIIMYDGKYVDEIRWMDDYIVWLAED